MAYTAALMEPSLDVDKLSYEIFSILESKFLFGYDDPKPLLTGIPPGAPPSKALPSGAAGKVRILSIDAGSGLLAAVSLARLEASLRKCSGDPAAQIADYFDVAAGSGAGGVLAAMLFTRGADGRQLFSADEALQFLTKNRKGISTRPRRRMFRWISRRSGGRFGRIFSDATLRDTVKPVLIPCYDLATGAPFLFSRADAVEADSFDFLMRDVCAATCADPSAGAVEMRSVDGRTRIAAVGGGLAMGNPTAAAITHVLNNKQEFPLATGVEDLLVVSLGRGEVQGGGMGVPSPPSAELVRIAGEGLADMVDQAVAMAFGHYRKTNYVRIESNKFSSGTAKGRATWPVAPEESALSERNVESVLFRGRMLSEQTNGEKLELFSGELIKEHERRRRRSAMSAVVIKQSMTPRTSFATTATTSTTASSTTFSSSL